MRPSAIPFALATLAIAAVGFTSAQVPVRLNNQNVQQVATQAALAASSRQEAQSPSKKDSLTTAIQLSNLRTRKSELQRQIKEQDSKRNRQIAGVAPETLEAMNDSQDSLCLALRSELVEVNLQINELAPAQVSPQVLNQFHRIVNNHSNDSVATQTVNPSVASSEALPVPAKPAKK